jgi:hypothetical protein
MNSEIPTSGARPDTGASGINILLGLWILISPFAMGFHHLQAALWNNVAAGILIAAFAFFRVSKGHHQAGWSWGNAFLGLWLIISPFVLGFAHTLPAKWNNIIVGAIIGLLACVSANSTKRQTATPTL